MLKLFFCLLLAGCSLIKDNKAKDTTSDIDEVVARRVKVLAMSEGAQDAYSFTGGIGDSLLFSCLHKASGAVVDYLKAEEEPGRFVRHPKITPEISNTPFSRDMLMGLLFCIRSAKDLATLERVIEYGLNHKWDMCGAAKDYKISMADRTGRCLVTPQLQATIFELYVSLGGDCGEDCQFVRKTPQVWNKGETDFRLHLLVLHTLLRGLIQGAINDNQVEMLKAASDRNPRNALFSAVYHLFTDGDQSQASASLLDESLFPKDRLPTAKDNYCTHYLFQRDEQKGGLPNPDWLPCDEPDTHSGVDWLFAAAVVTGDIK